MKSRFHFVRVFVAYVFVLGLKLNIFQAGTSKTGILAAKNS